MKATQMRTAPLAMLALALATAGCGGGGAVSPTVSAPTSASGPPATMSLSISIPNRAASASARTPQYVSDGTMALAVYDGATLLYIGNLLPPGPAAFSTVYANPNSTSTVTPGNCVRGNLASTCTLTVTTTPGPHTFGMTAYGNLQGGVILPGSTQRNVLATGPPAFTGLILSEGEFSMTAVGGTNPQQTITLLGVADIVQWFGQQTATFNATATIGYAVQDARSGQIVLPGNSYDNGPVTITVDKPSAVTFTPISQSTPPATGGSQTFDIKCIAQNTTDVTFTASAGTQPNTTYASGLTYNSGNYPSAMGGVLSTRTFRCFGNPLN